MKRGITIRCSSLDDYGDQSMPRASAWQKSAMKSETEPPYIP